MEHKASPSLGSEAVRLTTSKVLTTGITMITSMLLARFRTIEEYGTYSQLLLVINLFVSFLMLGLPNSINFFLARAESEEDKQRFLSVYYTLSTLLSVVIGASLVVSIPLIEAYFHNQSIRSFVFFLFLFPWTSIITSSIENVYVVYQKAQRLMLFRTVYSASVLLTVLVVQWLGYGFKVYMVVFTIVNVFYAFFVYAIASKLCGRIRPLFDKSIIRAVFVFSIPMGLSTVVGTLNTEIDKLLIGYLMNTEQLAIYSNAAKELPLIMISSSITAVLLPQIARMMKQDNKKQAVQLWSIATELAFIFISFIVFGVFTYAEEAMTFLYSSKYLAGVGVFRVYTLNLLLRCTYFGMVLNACGETKKIFYCSVLSLGLNLILNPLFYWLFGMIGPAIATFIAILILLLVQLRMTAKTGCLRFSEVFPWRKIAIILLINIGFAVVFWFIKRILPLEKMTGDVLESIILGGVWTIMYLLLMRMRIRKNWHALNDGGNGQILWRIN